MLQRKIAEILKEIPNVYGIANDILVLGYDDNDRDHENTLSRLLQIYRKVNLKLNKDRCHSICSSVPFLV